MDSLLQLGLGNALLATALALLAAVLGRVCRRPALTHGLWLLVLLKLVTPPLAPFRVAWGETPLAPPAPAAVEPVAVPDLPEQFLDDDPADQLSPGMNPPATLELAPAAEPDPPIESSDWSPSNDGPRQTLSEVPEPSVAFPWRLVLTLTWAAGTIGWFALASKRIDRFRRLLACGCEAPEGVQTTVRQLALRMGIPRCPRVWLVPGPVSPHLWAVGGRPRLVVPEGLFARLNAEQQAALFVHELAHLRRRDHWVRLLEFLATGLYWWHPVVWWARREIAEAEEECCDAWVVSALPGSARDYGLALLETVDFLSEVRLVLPPAASGIGQAPFLRRRLTMIMSGNIPRALSGLGVLVLLGLGFVVLPWGLSMGQTATQPALVPPAAVPVVPPPVDVSANAVDPRSREDQLEAARDDVELLEAQLAARQAGQEEVKSKLDAAEQKLARLQELSRQGVAGQGALADATAEVAALKAQYRSREIELREPAIRLKQAQRRLNRLTATSKPTMAANAEPPKNTVSPQLKKRIAEILLELESGQDNSAQAMKKLQDLLESTRAVREQAADANVELKKYYEELHKLAAKAHNDQAVQRGLDYLRKQQANAAPGTGGPPGDKLSALESKVNTLEKQVAFLTRELKELKAKQQASALSPYIITPPETNPFDPKKNPKALVVPRPPEKDTNPYYAPTVPLAPPRDGPR